MKLSISSCEGIAKVLRLINIAGVLTALLSSYAISAPSEETTPPGTPTSGEQGAKSIAPSSKEQQSSEEIKRRGNWNKSMMQKSAPKKGCFTAAYPSTEWLEVQCGPKRDIPMVPGNSGPRLDIVGGGGINDISTHAPSGHISQAIGHFENITNLTSESGPIGNSGPAINNAYTLQINTNQMDGVCSGSPNPNCKGWQQFVYENTGSAGHIYIQYWLIKYNTTCPSGQNWNQFSFTGQTDIYCWKNNSGGTVNVPNQPITNIGNWTFSGRVSSTGDSVTMSTGTNVYTQNGDNAVNASNGWTTAEFNIFGDGGNSSGGGMASFNTGASVDTRTEIIYGGNTAPDCTTAGFTGETNNLSFGPTTPAKTPPGPAVIFTESTAGGNVADCIKAVEVGDTHIQTFNGLFYDFQASGDFILAEVNPKSDGRPRRVLETKAFSDTTVNNQSRPSFIVQTRKVSGAPTWPNASINNAVAVQAGNTRVALCLAPTRLKIDGKTADLSDGKSISLPDGVDILRKGNTYFIVGQEGDSVRAVANPTWMDVSVGLGHWPAKVRGLLVNADGNVNQIATRDGAVLSVPFSFDDLYHRYADSWRVPAKDSLLSVCGDKEIERGIPTKPFYAKDLDPKIYEHTRAVCTMAGVKAGPLLDACTLDVAVIGDDTAAKVFVTIPTPVIEAKPMDTKPGGSEPGPIQWLLLLIVIAFILWIFLIQKTP